MFRWVKSSFVAITFLSICLGGPLAQAQSAKPLLDTKLIFSKDGKANIQYTTYASSREDAETNKIQSALIFYAIAMNKLGDSERKVLMNQVQASVSKIATEKGLVRANLIEGISWIKALKSEPLKEGLQLRFTEIAGKSHSLEMIPADGGGQPLDAAVMYMFQDLTKNLSESGLRLTVLAMGAMNKWYRELGQASDPESLAKAPAYALNLAVDIVEKLQSAKK